MADTLASLEIELTAKVDGLTAALNTVQGQLQAVSSEVLKTDSDVESGFATMESAAGSAKESVMAFTDAILGAMAIRFSVEGLVDFTKSALDAANQAVELSERLGITTDQVQQLSYVATQSGTDMQSIAQSMSNMGRVLGTASEDNGAAAIKAQQAFGALGLSWQQLAKESPTDQFITVLGAIGQLNTKAEQNKASVDILGRSYQQLGSLVGVSGNQLRQMMAEDTNIASPETLEHIHDLSIEWENMKTQMQVLVQEGFVGLKNNADDVYAGLTVLGGFIAGNYIPAIYSSVAASVSAKLAAVEEAAALGAQQVAMDEASGAAATNAAMQEALAVAQKAAAGSIAESTIFVGEGGVAVEAATTALGRLTAGAGLAGEALLAALGGPVGAIIAGVTALGAAIYVLNDNVQASVDPLKQVNDLDNQINANAQTRINNIKLEREAVLAFADARLQEAQAALAQAQADQAATPAPSGSVAEYSLTQPTATQGSLASLLPDSWTSKTPSTTNNTETANANISALAKTVATLQTQLDSARTAADAFDASLSKHDPTTYNDQLAKANASVEKSIDDMQLAAQASVADELNTDPITKAIDKINTQVDKLKQNYLDTNHAVLQLSTTEQQSVDNTKDLVAEAAALTEIQAAITATRTPLETYTHDVGLLQEAWATLEKTPNDITPEMTAAYQRQMDNLNDSIDEYKSLFDSTSQDVDSDFEKMFSGLMDGSVNSLQSFSNIFLGTFETMLAKMATLAIMNPVIVPIIESLGSTLGISTTGINSVISKLDPAATLMPGTGSASSVDPAGTSGIAGDASSLSSALSIAGLASKAESLYSSLSNGTWLSSAASSLGLGGITSGIDNFGSTYLGTANADAVADGLDSGATLSQGLGSGLADAGAGFAGNYLGNTLFGRTGSSATDADIGGTVGALAGSELGPIGSAVGSFLGNALGGLFGAPVSDKAEATDLSFATNDVMDTTGATSGSKYSAANRSVSDGITAFAQQVNAMLTAATGSTIQNNLTVKAGSRDGNYFTIWGNSQTDFSNTTQGLQELTGQLTDLYAATGKSAADVTNLKTAIGHIDFSNTTQALSDINFALNFDNLGKAATVVTTVDTEVANLTSTFATYQQTAERLGLSISQLNTYQQEQMALLQSSYVQSTNGSLLDGILPGYSDFEKQSESYSTAMKDAVTLGLSAQQISTITLENNIEVQELLQSNNAAYKQSISDANTLVSTYGNLSDSWSTLIASLTTGSDSTLSSTAQLDALRQQVQSEGAAAATGDTTAQSDLLTLIPEFISASQSVNGYDAAYASDQQLALSYAEDAKSVSDQQLAVQQSILDAADDATSLLTTIAGTGTSGNANDKLVAAIKAGYTGLTNDQIDAIFDSVGLTVAPGGGARTGALNQSANSGINTSLNDIFHALGVPGFATGGQIGGGGKPGVDSIPLIAMPGEFVMRAKAVSALGAPTLNYMNATGRLPSNDNGGDIAALRSDVQLLTKIVYGGFDDNNGHLKAIRGATASSAATANRALNRAAS